MPQRQPETPHETPPLTSSDAQAAPAAAQPVGRPPVTQRGALRFFLPLIVMTELNMISKSAIHAFLARLVAPKIALAAFNTSFFLFFTASGSAEVYTYIALSYLRTRRSLLRLLGFCCLVSAPPLALTFAVGFTPLGDWVYGSWFGASGEVVRQAKLSTVIFGFCTPILMFRSPAFALIMMNRRTFLITLSTLVRLLSLGVSLVLYPVWLHGAMVGAAALVTCMYVETFFGWGCCWRYYRALPSGTGADAPPLPGYGTLWRFSWPLMLNQSSEMGVVMIVNLFLGRLATPDLALAAFGVVHGLAGLLFGPLRNLVQTAQTLTQTGEDMRVMLRFTLWLSSSFAVAVALLFFSPAGDWVLSGVMGLTPELAEYCEPAVRIIFILAVFWAMAALFRGLLAGAQRTRTLAVSAIARIAVVAAIGSLTVAFGTLNGAMVGMAAWMASYAVETGVLGWRLFSRGKEGPLYPRQNAL